MAGQARLPTIGCRQEEGTMRNAVHRSGAGSAGRLAKLPRIFFCLTVAVALQPAAAWAARPAAPQNPATSGTSLTQGRPASGDPISLAGHDRDVTVESLK